MNIRSAVRLYCNEDPAIQWRVIMKSEQTKWDGGPWLKKGLG